VKGFWWWASKKRGFGLDDCLIKRELVSSLDKELQTSFKDHVGDFSPEQLEYAARDVLYSLPHARLATTQARKEGILNTWLLECKAMPAFGDIEFDGQTLDKEQWKQVMELNRAAAVQAKADLDEFVAPFCAPDLFGELDRINYDSSSQLLGLMQDMKIKVPERDPKTNEVKMVLIKNTSKETQKKIKDLPIIKLIEKYRKAKKGLGTYGESYLNAIHPRTGRIHPEIDQIGTDTGRPANRGEVSFLNIPRDNRYRHALVALPGWVIETDDYSGCELRILAEQSGEPKWVDAFINHVDVHCLVASDLYGIPVSKKGPNAHLRTPGKTLNLGLAYGMGPGKLCDDLNAAGFKITLDESRALYHKYTGTYRRNTESLKNWGKLAAHQGYLANMNGRRRYWNLPDPKAYKDGPIDQDYRATVASIQREGGNFMIQSVNADISKLAMYKLRKYIKEKGIRSEIVNQIYDEIVTHTHKDDTEEFVVMKRKLMNEAAHCWLHNVPMEVDGYVGPYWHKD
jgi:DNA polymerase I